jgi:hypothetical protein
VGVLEPAVSKSGFIFNFIFLLSAVFSCMFVCGNGNVCDDANLRMERFANEQALQIMAKPSE